jgi:hypothetical protein
MVAYMTPKVATAKLALEGLVGVALPAVDVRSLSFVPAP